MCFLEFEVGIKKLNKGIQGLEGFIQVLAKGVLAFKVFVRNKVKFNI